MTAFLKRQTARAIASIEAGWLRWFAKLGAWVAVGVIVVVLLVVWKILGFEITNTSEAADQGQLLVAAAGFVLTAALVATTIYYARQTKHLVDEARGARERDDARHAETVQLERNREIEGTVAALHGASLDIVKAGAMLITMRRNWRLWRVRQAEPLMQAMTSASKATDLLRYRAPGAVSSAADALHTTLLDLTQFFMSGADDSSIARATRSIAQQKSALDAALFTLVSVRRASPTEDEYPLEPQNRTAEA